MKIIDVFNENGKTMNEILEEYVLIILQSIIDNKILHSSIELKYHI
jgi:hypothetical protein